MPRLKTNADEMNVKLQNFGTLTEKSMQDFVQQFAQDMSNEIIRTTPVKTGYLRASWKGSVGRGGASDPMSAASKMKAGDTFTLINYAAYARRVEFGFIGTDSLGRHYHQSGRGWIRAALARAQSIAAAALLKI